MLLQESGERGNRSLGCGPPGCREHLTEPQRLPYTRGFRKTPRRVCAKRKGLPCPGEKSPEAKEVRKGPGKAGESGRIERICFKFRVVHLRVVGRAVPLSAHLLDDT